MIVGIYRDIEVSGLGIEELEPRVKGFGVGTGLRTKVLRFGFEGSCSGFIDT